MGYAERLHLFGEIRNKEQFWMLQANFKPIAELKIFKFRLFGYFAKGRKAFVLTHGFSKKSNKTPPAEVTRAKTIKEEYEGWLKNA